MSTKICLLFHGFEHLIFIARPRPSTGPHLDVPELKDHSLTGGGSDTRILQGRGLGPAKLFPLPRHLFLSPLQAGMPGFGLETILFFPTCPYAVTSSSSKL